MVCRCPFCVKLLLSGVVDQGPGDGYPLLLPAAELVGPLEGVVVPAQRAQVLHRPLLHLLGGVAAQLQARQHHVAEHVELLHQVAARDGEGAGVGADDDVGLGRQVGVEHRGRLHKPGLHRAGAGASIDN